MEDLVYLAYRSWKLMQADFGLPPLVINKMTPLANSLSQKVSIGEEVVVCVKIASDAFSVSSALQVVCKAGSRIFEGQIEQHIRYRLFYVPEIELLDFLSLSDEEKSLLVGFWCLKALSFGFNSILMAPFPENITLKSLIEFNVYELIIGKISSFDMFCGIEITNVSNDELSLLSDFLVAFKGHIIFHRDISRLVSENNRLLHHESIVSVASWLETIIPRDVVIILKISDFVPDGALVYLFSAISSRCLISFDAFVKGGYRLSPKKPHAIWTFFKNKVMHGELPVVPIFDAGLSGVGGGMWPFATLNGQEALVQTVKSARFPGVIALSKYVPRGNGFLECALWVFGQLLCRQTPFQDLYDTWMKGSRPEWYWPISLAWLSSSVAEIIVSLDELPLTNDERIVLEWIESCINLIEEHKVEDVFLKSYVTSFTEHVRNKIRPLPDSSISNGEEVFHPFSTEGLVLHENGMKLF